MQVTQEQIAALLKLQAIDSECARLNKQLDELPQKMAILDVRHKKAALAEKRRTIVGMHKDTQTQLAHAEGEDADLARKSKVAQAAPNRRRPRALFRGEFLRAHACAEQLQGDARVSSSLFSEEPAR